MQIDKIFLVLSNQNWNINRMLSKACMAAGIDYQKISPLFLDYLGNNWPHMSQSQTVAIRTVLDKEIKDREPNVIAVVGDIGYEFLTNETNLLKKRGSIAEYKGVKLIGLQDPEWIMRGNIQAFWYLVNDLNKVKAESEYPERRQTTWKNIINPTYLEAMDFLKGIPLDALWSFDIETRANHLACYSIAYDNVAMCIPVQNPTGPAFNTEYEASLLLALNQVFTTHPNLVGQNLTFDLDYMLEYGLEPCGIYMDTMLSHAILYPEFPKGLDFLVSFYTSESYHKAEGKISNPNITLEGLWSYNNKDTYTTLLCAREIAKQLKERDLWGVHEFVTEELGLALEMQCMGIEVSQDNKDQISGWLTEEEDAITAMWEGDENSTLTKLAGDIPMQRPNVNSPAQMQTFLYSKSAGLGLPIKTRLGSVVSDEQAINELKANHPIPQLDWILRERHTRKLRSSYLNAVTDER